MVGGVPSPHSEAEANSRGVRAPRPQGPCLLTSLSVAPPGSSPAELVRARRHKTAQIETTASPVGKRCLPFHASDGTSTGHSARSLDVTNQKTIWQKQEIRKNRRRKRRSRPPRKNARLNAKRNRGSISLRGAARRFKPPGARHAVSGATGGVTGSAVSDLQVGAARRAKVGGVPSPRSEAETNPAGGGHPAHKAPAF